MCDSKLVDRGEVVFGNEFGEGLAPVVADGLGFGGASGGQFGEVGDEVVASTLLEFGWEVGGPVGAVDFERVGEDGVGGLIAEGFEERGGYVGEVFVDGCAGKVV